MRSILILLMACTPAMAAEPGSQPTTQPASQPAAPQAGRLSAEQIEALGAPPEGPCSGRPLDLALPAKACVARGPFPGEIKGGKKGEGAELKQALAACAADPTCVGISTHWYTGVPWTPISGDARVAVDKASYGCAVVLDCTGAKPEGEAQP
ncbi:MAG: hypothetical protein KC583_16270 [Myxococcales bacterium]|nr:hypothetical protein [Myxococcales bacterium]